MYKLKLITVKVRSLRLLLVFFALLSAFLFLLEILSVASDKDTLITDNSSRIAFIKSLGITSDESLAEEKEIYIPEKFTDVWQKYNDVQLKAGYDLSLFAGKKAKLYKYLIADFRDNATAYVNLIVLDGRIIGGDISSAELNGFMLPLKELEN